MKKLNIFIVFSLLVIFLYGCTSVKEEKIKACKKNCPSHEYMFCKRICEYEIFDSRWVFLGFTPDGSGAYFYDPLSVTKKNSSRQVWIKLILSEEPGLQTDRNIDHILARLTFYCDTRSFEINSYYAYDNFNNIKHEKKFLFPQLKDIIPGTYSEVLFNKICQKRNHKK